MSDIKDIAVKKEVKELVKEPSETEALQKEILKLDLEAKRLELKERHANLQDLEERLAERELRRETVRQRSITNGATIRALAEADALVQKRCTHRKGGEGAAGVIGGQGQASQYAVMKHTMINGDTWVRCLRCGKTWKPSIREDFDTEAAYLAKEAEYTAALNFQTLNSTSGSCQFRFSDGGKYFREVMRHSTLR